MITGHLIGVTVNKGFDCTQKSCSGVCLVKKSMVEDCLVHLEKGGGNGGWGGCGGVHKKQVRLDPNSTNNLRRLRQDWYFWFGLRLLKFSLLHFINFS